jgi:hypothetical protein
MNYGIKATVAEQLAKKICVNKITFDKPCLRRDGSPMTSGKVVQNRDSITSLKQELGCRATYVACAASD